MGRVKAALDSEGKSPLALCLEFKMNDWQRSAEILKEAYKVRRSTSSRAICLLSLKF